MRPLTGRPTVTFRVGGKDRKFTIEDPLVYQSLQPLAGSGFDSLETVLGSTSKSVARDRYKNAWVYHG